MATDTCCARRSGVVAIEHDLFRLVVKAILESELSFTQVVVANCLEDVLDRLTDADGIDLVIFDLTATGVIEVSHLSILRECFPDVRLVVSGPMRRADILHALHAGVHGYISDAMSVQDLTPALAMVVGGKIFVPDIVADVAPHPLTRIAALVRSHKREDFEITSLHDAATEPSLTPRQQDVLRLVVQGQSNKAIARTLNLRESTVKVHVAAIFRALGVHNRSGAAGLGMHFISPIGSSIINHRDRKPVEPKPPAETVD